jgi:hypothetical protein
MSRTRADPLTPDARDRSRRSIRFPSRVALRAPLPNTDRRGDRRRSQRPGPLPDPPERSRRTDRRDSIRSAPLRHQEETHAWDVTRAVVWPARGAGEAGRVTAMLRPDTEPLAAAERGALRQPESVLQAGQRPFITVGEALAALRDARLYPERGSFEEDCARRQRVLERRRDTQPTPLLPCRYSVIPATRGRHSEKPAIVPAIIERFTRTAPAPRCAGDNEVAVGRGPGDASYEAKIP